VTRAAQKQRLLEKGLKHFDVSKVTNKNMLNVPSKAGKTNTQYYITNNEMYNILYEIHIRNGHSGRTHMLKKKTQLQQKLFSVSSKSDTCYLCQHLQVHLALWHS
jgi:hypothetical protein